MTAALYLHGKAIPSVFDLLGDKENDITFSIGWALARCPEFRGRLIHAVIPKAAKEQVDTVRLQEHGRGGITDIELTGPNVHVIVEAKRGFLLPGEAQLRRYADRLARSPRRHRAIVTLSNASRTFAGTRLPVTSRGMPCVHLSLADVEAISRHKSGRHAEKRLLAELSTYLHRIARMQDINSNLVYVVSLSGAVAKKSRITWREIVEVHGRYFHPVGGSYPREAVNYFGFRYNGRLQSIRHVEAVEVVSSLGHKIPGCRFPIEGPHYLYTLGAPIIPSKTVRNGQVVMANRVYAAIDLLLTCDTISEAGAKTRLRLGR